MQWITEKPMKEVFEMKKYVYIALCFSSLALAEPPPTIALGAPQLKNPEFIEKFNKTCYALSRDAGEGVRKNCFLGLKNDISVPEGESRQIANLGQGRTYWIEHVKIPSPHTEKEFFRSFYNLVIKIEGQEKAKITIDEMLSGSFGYTHLSYYLKNDKLYLVQLYVNELGMFVDFWKEYTINLKRPSFDLVRSIFCIENRDNNGHFSQARVCQDATFKDASLKKN